MPHTQDKILCVCQLMFSCRYAIHEIAKTHINVFVVVLILTHCYNAVRDHRKAPMTLECKDTSGAKTSKTEDNTHNK